MNEVAGRKVVEEDGVLGSKSIKALNGPSEQDRDKVMNAIADRRENLYRKLVEEALKNPKDEKTGQISARMV